MFVLRLSHCRAEMKHTAVGFKFVIHPLRMILCPPHDALHDRPRRLIHAAVALHPRMSRTAVAEIRVTVLIGTRARRGHVDERRVEAVLCL